MLKVILVDDERYVIDSLRATVDWRRHGFAVVGEARSGAAALELIRAQKPDLVFTDIRMPGMDGLELIRLATEEGLPARFVAVSGYAEFTYVQTAMKYGAVGFCLKPFDADEIESILRKVREAVEGRRSFLGFELLESLDEGTPAAWARALRILGELGFPCAEGVGLAVVVAVGSGSFSLAPGVSSVEVRLGPQKRLHLACLPAGAKGTDWLGITGVRDVSGIGYAEATFTREGLRAGLLHADLAAHQHFVRPGTVLADYARIAHDGARATAETHRLEAALESHDDAAVRAALDRLREAAREGRLTIQHLLLAYNRTMAYLGRRDAADREEYLFRHEQLAALHPDADAMLDDLAARLGRTGLGRTAALPEEIRNEKFREILRYVNQNFTRDLSLQSISAQFNFNANYLSQLFKKTLSTTFTDYVTTLRVAHASELLLATNLSVSEVAERAGYDDYFYFTRVFKKATGMTASGFKASRRAEGGGAEARGTASPT